MTQTTFCYKRLNRQVDFVQLFRFGYLNVCLFIAFLYLFPFSSQLVAQQNINYDIQLGEEYKGFSAREKVHLLKLKEDSTGFYVLRNVATYKRRVWKDLFGFVRFYDRTVQKDYGTYYIEYYDDTLHCVKSGLVFDTKDYKNNLMVVDAFEWEAFFYIFLEDKLPFKRMKKLYVLTIDKSTFEPVGEMRLLAQLSTRKGDKWRQGEGFHIFYNNEEEGKKELVVFAVNLEKGKNKGHVEVKVFDEDFELERSFFLNFPDGYDLFQVRDVLFDDKGNVHVLAKLFANSRENCIKRKRNVSWRLYVFLADGTLKIHPLVFPEDIYAYHMQIYEDTDTSVLCIGLSSTCNPSTISPFSKPLPRFRGIAIFSFSKENLEEIEHIYTDLPEEVNNFPAIPPTSVRTLFRNDGGFILVLERWGVQAQSLTLFSFSFSGKLEWFDVLIKGEKSRGFNKPPRIPFNYALSIADDKILLFHYMKEKCIEDYNKNVEKYKAPQGIWRHCTLPKNKKKWILGMIVLSTSGEILLTKEVFSYDDIKNVVDPGEGIRLKENKNELLLYGTYEKKFRMLKLVFDELAKHDRL